MEMEFKDNSRRRTLVLVVGVLLALAAGAAAFMLSSQGQEEPEAAFPTRDVVVAAEAIPARTTIESLQLAIRPVPVDDTTASAYTDRDEVTGQVSAIPILQFQPITPNMLAGAASGQVQILKADETVAPDSPILRAVSLTVPADRAVAGLVAVGQHVDLIATIPITVTGPVDPETGEPLAVDPETGEPLTFVDGSTTKLMWLDVEILARETGSDVYIVRADLQTSEEIAHAQTQGAEFTMVLRPDEDTRDVDRSTYGETTDTLLTRYNFRVPEKIDGLEYGQPLAFPSPFPNEPYLSPAPEPSPSPESALIVAPTESPVP
jgi:Flp pilus assembly protein CpaB